MTSVSANGEMFSWTRALVPKGHNLVNKTWRVRPFCTGCFHSQCAQFRPTHVDLMDEGKRFRVRESHDWRLKFDQNYLSGV